MRRFDFISDSWIDCVFVFEDVGIDYFGVLVLSELLFCDFRKGVVNFDSQDETSVFCQLFGQRTGAAAGFEDDIVFLDLCGINKFSHQI